MPLRAREGDDVVHGEEVGLVLQLRDQRELVLDQLAHLGGRGRAAERGGAAQRRAEEVGVAAAVAAGEPALGELAQARRGRLARRHDLLADTRSAARRARTCSARAIVERRVESARADRSSRAARASAGAARRWEAARSRIRRAACAGGSAVSVSCSARRARTCMCTSPAATSGRPLASRQRRAAREPRARRRRAAKSSTAIHARSANVARDPAGSRRAASPRRRASHSRRPRQREAARRRARRRRRASARTCPWPRCAARA